MKCAQEGCEKEAVIQWLQDLEDPQVFIDNLHSQLAAFAENRRLGYRLRMAALQDARDNPSPNLSPDDARAFRAQAETQLGALQKEHDQVPLSFDLEHHRAGASRALGACEEHQHDNPEWYAVQHSASCSGATDCGCS